jgi:hypothetical protein
VSKKNKSPRAPKGARRKADILSTLERVKMELRAAAEVIMYVVCGGDIKAPIAIDELMRQPVRRLIATDVEVDGKKCVQFSLRPVDKVTAIHATGQGVEITSLEQTVDGKNEPVSS